MDSRLRSAASGARRLASGDRAAVVLRLLVPIVLIEVALWVPLRLGILFGIAALWYITYQLWKAASSSRSLGLDWRGVISGSWLLIGTMVLAGAILAAAYFTGTLHTLWGLKNPWYAAVAYCCWAFIQEFMLQCFCARMLRALVSRVAALLLSGVVFSVAHLPNPNLTLVTFFAGVAFTAIYLRKRNLWVVATIHAVLGLTLAVSTPDAWFHELRVGREFLEKPQAIAVEVPPSR